MTDHSAKKYDLDRLTRLALQMGATGAAVIESAQIVISDDLAALCDGEYTCPNYGLSASCPPHVPGPDVFRKWQAQSLHSITVKIELPASILFSPERQEISRLLHQIVAAVEIESRSMGFKRSKAFAGGSCKPLFCPSHDQCQVTGSRLPCRHPDEARPSMSGFGIDVTRLMNISGWPLRKNIPEDTSDTETQGWMAGLILLAK